jgi:DNA-directed RNA polymerase subunit RPC12/RpoP
MPIYHIEMLWKCSICKAENKGLQKICVNCGKPKQPTDKDYFPGDISPHTALTKSKDVEQALAGPDWKCRYCGSAQKRLDGHCAQCGADQYGNQKVEIPKTRANINLETGKTYISVPPVEEDQSEEEHISFIPPNRKRLVQFLIPIIVGIVILGLYLLFRKHEVSAHITSVNWVNTVIVDRFQVWHREGWSSDAKSFNIKQIDRRVHHYDKVYDHTEKESYTDQEPCGTTPVICHTTPVHCTPNGNGTASCSGGDQECSGGDTKYCSVTKYRDVPVYRDEPVFRPWYTWDVWDWGFNRKIITSGSTIEVKWPSDEEIKLNEGCSPTVSDQGIRELERANRESAYKVVFTEDKNHKIHNYTPKSLNDFQRFHVGSSHRLMVSFAGTFDILQ